MTMARFNRHDSIVSGALALVMLITRPQWLDLSFHLPDTSLAIFFLAGFYVRPRLAFPLLLLLAIAIDFISLGGKVGPSSCFTPAYWMLVLSYGAMWLAGLFGRGAFGARLSALLALVLLLAGASFVAKLFSSGGYYWLSGKFSDPTLTEFLARMARYFPDTLAATLLWAGISVVVHAALQFLPRGDTAGRARP
jgi:hypothetical protein